MSISLAEAISEAQHCLRQRGDGKLSSVVEKRLLRSLGVGDPDRLAIATQIMTALIQKMDFNINSWLTSSDALSDKRLDDLHSIEVHVRIAFSIADELRREGK